MKKTGKIDRAMAVAEEVMAEDREILEALAASEPTDQMTVARAVMQKRHAALKKLSQSTTEVDD